LPRQPFAAEEFTQGSRNDKTTYDKNFFTAWDKQILASRKNDLQ